MKKILLFICLWASLQSYSQNFTNGSVYNYDVGDTIVTASHTYTYPNIPDELTYRMFIQKNFSVTHDTIYYVAKDVKQTITVDIYNSWNTPTITVVTYTFSFSVTNLQLSLISYTPTTDSCVQESVTTGTDACGSHYWEYSAFLKSFCSPDAIYWSHTFIEGIGVFSDSYHQHGGSRTYLVSAHKANGCSYGTVGPIPTTVGIAEWEKQNNRLSIYPNPTKNDFFVKLEEKGTIIAYDVLGNSVYKESLERGENKIDITSFPTGIYNIVCFSKNNLYTNKLIKE